MTVADDLRAARAPKMIHLLVDERPDYRSWDEDGCPIGGIRQLAAGHAYVNDTAAACLHVTCPLCLPECQQLGKPISQLSGRPGHDGYAKFVSIAQSWGYP